MRGPVKNCVFCLGMSIINEQEVASVDVKDKAKWDVVEYNRAVYLYQRPHCTWILLECPKEGRVCKSQNK